MIVKICGITRPEDAAAAARAGADWIGLNFWPRSKRFVTADRVGELVRAARDVREEIEVVGVFVDQELEEVLAAVKELALDYAQLHGDEPPAYAARLGERGIKAVGVSESSDLDRLAEYECPLVLVDTPSPGRGGSGIVGDWRVARRAAARRRVLLAGGLTPDNVAQAIAAVHPFGVDVASGVEIAPGVKDPELMVRFVREAREADERGRSARGERS
ncbi:MAG TPA: phosphoribosylanthranilate isomerase [Kofleriaceae bacterium]|nr:phosphoribosylanthranilate isomerase [Kofleriaceae bacterium]